MAIGTTLAAAGAGQIEAAGDQIPYRRRSLFSVVPLRTVAGLALITVLLGAGCSNDVETSDSLRDPAAAADAALTAGASEPGSDISETTVPPGPEIGVTINQYLLDANDCFNRVEGLTDGRKVVTTTLIPCDSPHQAQIFELITYPADGSTPYPGAGVMNEFALAACYQSFAPWVGQSYEESILSIRVIVPTQENFDGNQYRRIHCYVERRDGADLLGSTAGRGI